MTRETVAVCGVGTTDFAADYPVARTDLWGHAVTAYRRALADGGARHGEVDGIVTGPGVSPDRLADLLGIDARWSAQADAGGALMLAALALRDGLADCVCLLFSTEQRSGRTQFGGPRAMGADAHLEYHYYRHWGLTSQGALYALTARRWLWERGLGVERLAQVPIAASRFAVHNPAAIRREELDLASYLAAPVIVEPLRRPDYCLVNDGAVGLLLRRPADLSTPRRRAARPVAVAAWASAGAEAGAASLRPRLFGYYHEAHRRAADEVYRRAGIGPGEVDCLQIYDSFSIKVPLVLEGFGFCGPDRIGRMLDPEVIGPGGRYPVNTAGGHLRESYLWGWGHLAEAVRQARGEAGDRQCPRHDQVQYISDAAGKVRTVIFRRM